MKNKKITIFIVIALIAVLAWYYFLKKAQGKPLFGSNFKRLVDECKKRREEFKKSGSVFANMPTIRAWDSCEEEVAKRLSAEEQRKPIDIGGKLMIPPEYFEELMRKFK